MLTFTHLPTFRGAPPDGVWHQHLHGARYVKGGVAADVRSNGFVYVSAPPPAAPLRHTHCCKTIDRAFAAAEAEVKVQDEFVRGVAMFEELRRRGRAKERVAPLDGACPVINPGMGGAGQKPTPTIQGNYRVVDSIEWSPVNEWHFSRDYPQWLHLRACGKTHIVRGAPDGYNTVISHHSGLTYPTQHEAMAAVLAAAYPVDREVAYVKEGEPRPDGWSMRVDKPGWWDFAIGNRLRGSAIYVTPSGKYVACGIKDASFAVVASAVEHAAKVSAAQAQRDLREKNIRALGEARLRDIYTKEGWKRPGDAGGRDAVRDVGGCRHRIFINGDGRVSLLATSLPGWYSMMDFDTVEEALEAADKQAASVVDGKTTPTHIAIGQVWRSRDGDKAMVTKEAGGCYRFRVGGASLDVGSSGKILDYGGCTYVGKVEIK